MSSGDTILRVLNGRLAGTERRLPASGTVSIGHQFWQDVVIRDAATKGIAIDLTFDADAARITVLEGEAALLGSTVEAGGTALLPPYVPFTIGGVALAWGEADSDRWSEATGLAALAPTPPDMPPSARDHALAVVGRAGAGIGGVFTRSRVLMVVAVIGFIILASVAMPVVDALNLRGDPPTRVARAMTAAGLTGLSANGSGDGPVTVTGIVANEAQRTKATDTLRGTGVDGTIAVQTSADLARAAADVARIHGLQAVARPTGRTTVELRVTPLEPDQEQKLAQAVRGDVRGLTRLTLRDDLPPVDDNPVRSVQDATKKVSTVVAGDPSYIQTVDGARYFAGAMMPSGHRLVGIQGNTVFLEKNGRETRLTF